MRDETTVRGLQERAARALPAEQVETTAEGWWLRYAPGCSWWVGTALPHGETDTAALPRQIADAERFYADRGSVARFQITPVACPDDLDDILAARGYRREGLISLQAARIVDVAPFATSSTLADGSGNSETSARAGEDPDRLDVRLDESPTDAWFSAWCTIHGGDVDRSAERELLSRVPPPVAYASVLVDGEVVAVGRSVTDAGWAGVFGMGTTPRARGRGAATRVLAALAVWAGDQGADGMYLQVERDNARALRLYERVGFRELSRFHYRAGR